MPSVQLRPFEACSFFHGTTALHAERIDRQGSTNYLELIGAQRLAIELWSRLTARHGGVNGAVERLQTLDCMFTNSAAMAMASITSQVPAQNFEYGDLYVTLGLQRAARYALRNRYGSELLGIIADLIKALRADGDDLDSLLLRFPKLAHAISEPTPPVVIEFSGIGMHQATDVSGDAINHEWITMTEQSLDVVHPSNGGSSFDLRLKYFTRGNIARIYRLARLTQSDMLLLQAPGMGDNDLENRVRQTADPPPPLDTGR